MHGQELLFSFPDNPSHVLMGSSGITRGFSIGWCEGTGKKTKEFLEWNPGWAKPG